VLIHRVANRIRLAAVTLTRTDERVELNKETEVFRELGTAHRVIFGERRAFFLADLPKRLDAVILKPVARSRSL
jgi:hypothetical protein